MSGFSMSPPQMDRLAIQGGGDRLRKPVNAVAELRQLRPGEEV
jgi:hypothetical protein